MKNENSQKQNDEIATHAKKRTSNEITIQSEEIADYTKLVTDDEYLKHVIASDLPLETELIKKQSHIGGNRRSKSPGLTEKEYFETFFKIPKENASKGRSVYIRPEFHQKFLKLIAGLEIDRLTMYAYLDNIIEHHFMQFEEMIYKIYQERNKPLF